MYRLDVYIDQRWMTLAQRTTSEQCKRIARRFFCNVDRGHRLSFRILSKTQGCSGFYSTANHSSRLKWQPLSRLQSNQRAA